MLYTIDKLYGKWPADPAGCIEAIDLTNGGIEMPIINVKLVENAFDSNQKRELVSKITDSVESIYPGLRDVTFVTIDDIKEGEWGIGGQAITSEKVAAHAKKNLEGQPA
jgi:4-oxalocrotonate tautomerase